MVTLVDKNVTLGADLVSFRRIQAEIAAVADAVPW
jgi:hypothetical protein